MVSISYCFQRLLAEDVLSQLESRNTNQSQSSNQAFSQRASSFGILSKACLSQVYTHCQLVLCLLGIKLDEPWIPFPMMAVIQICVVG